MGIGYYRGRAEAGARAPAARAALVTSATSARAAAHERKVSAVPPESRLAELHRLGQSPWFDYINRALIQRGGLKKMVERDGLGGVTSNPAIFEKSIGGGREYDDAILTMARQGLQAPEILRLTRRRISGRLPNSGHLELAIAS